MNHDGNQYQQKKLVREGGGYLLRKFYGRERSPSEHKVRRTEDSVKEGLFTIFIFRDREK